MAKAVELRSEIAHLRRLALNQTDPAVMAEIKAMIEELEGRARELDNGDGSS